MNKIFATLFLTLLFPLTVFGQTIVSSKTKLVTITPTVDTGAYTSGDLVGTKQTLSGAGACDPTLGELGLCGGIINSVVIGDASKQSGNFDIIIFNSDPVNTTFTDNGAFTVNSADLSKIVCVIPVTTQVSLGTNGASVNQSAGCIFSAKATRGVLYAAAVTRSTPTYAATALSFKYGILQD